MKKVICIFAVLIASINAISAQTPIEETKKISKEEVPVAVLKTYETDFSPLSDANGVWWVVYTKYSEAVQGRLTEKEVFRPIAYIFKGHGKHKGEARYTAEGKLESSKGLDRITPVGQK